MKHLQEFNSSNNLFLNLIYNIKKSKFFSDLYLATGPKSKNKEYINFFLKKKYKYFAIKNENNVTKRIFDTIKELNHEYIVLISGDCPVPHYLLIDRLLSKLIKKKDYDFVTLNRKSIHEGITIFKKEAWLNVYKNSKNIEEKENPGIILKRQPEKFKILKVKSKNIDKPYNIRLSIDTLSDLQFFKLVLLHSKRKYISLEDVIKFKFLNTINKNVLQRSPSNKEIKEINIITTFSKKFGMGHYNRSQILMRALNENTKSAVNIKIINSSKNIANKLNQKKINQLKSFPNSITIIDLPNDLLLKIKDKINEANKVIIIDNYFKTNFNNIKFIIPSIRKYNFSDKKVVIGKKYIFLSKDILYEKLKPINKPKFKFLFLTSGSKLFSEEILEFIKTKIKSNYIIIIGPLTPKKYINNLNRLDIHYVKSPKNIYEIMNNSLNIISFFGITAYEALSLNKNLFLISEENESLQRKKDINFLLKKNYANKFSYNSLLNKNSIDCLNKNIFNYEDFGANNTIKEIVKFIK